MKMILEDTVRGLELDISNGSHLFLRDEDGREKFKEWDKLDLETQAGLTELANQAEEIMEKGLKLLRNRSEMIWECRCDCGNIINVKESDLVSGRFTSCGCDSEE